jgi:hypothetical protein
MTLQKDMFKGALLAIAAVTLSACSFDVDSESEEVAEAAEAIGETGHNNVSPLPVDEMVLRRSTTDAAGITSSTNPDPLPLCKGGTITATGCVMKPEWESWLNVSSSRGDMMKGIAKCAVESSFTIQTQNGGLSFPGQWGLYQGWKSNRLNGQDKRERVSACILALLNGNNQELNICIIGPGGAPFSDACTDPLISVREGGFFGDLFAQNPTAYIVGPDLAVAADTGRVCTSSSSEGSYCCAEDDTSCSHHIVRAGSMEGPPEDKRCNSFATSGGFEYCTSFFSTREPGRTYTNVFTTFVPPLL